VKEITKIFCSAASILIVGCDPGLTIYQVRPAKVAGAASPQVTIHVRTSHQIIGETWYAPEVKVTNSSGASIAVTKVELAEGRATYENKPRSAGSYPLLISPGDTQVLDVWFDLKEGVGRTFHKPTELRVHYRSGDKEQIVSTTIVGGPLDTSIP